MSWILPSAPHAAPPSEFVTASGNQLMLEGEAWRAVGVNFWDMDAARVIAGDAGGCYYQHTDLDAYFDSSFRKIAMGTGATAVRTFGFMAQYTGGANPDWSSTDKMLHYARMYNVRVIPVLGQQYGVCGESLKTAAWYHCPPSTPGCTPGYKQVGPWGVSYRDYAVSVAARYKDDPTIAFWQLMNEAFVATSDPDALPDFAGDMAQAIRTEAGDTNHLISVGTVGANAGTGSQLETFHRLLACPSPCMDLASAHYYGAEALQGMPAQAGPTAEMVADTANPHNVRTDVEGRWLQVDGWRTVQGAIWDPRTQQPNGIRTWAVRIKGAATSRWSVQVDHVVVTTLAGPHVYEFESGTEGFTAQNGSTPEQMTGRADTGLGSLRVEIVDPSAGSMLVAGPEEDAAIQSVSLRLRVNFSAPLAQPPNELALSSYLREATVASNKPFVATELGAWQEVSPFSPDGHALTAQSLCAERAVDSALVPRVPYTAPHRALILDAMMELQFDREHNSSGALIWDWKDPAMLVTRSDGLPAVDPVLNCFTITPGDPTEAVLMKWASQTPNPAITSPGMPPGAAVRRLVGLPGPAWVKAGAAFVLKARVTDGGDPLGAVHVVASGDCNATGPTDALGHASVVCRLNSPGTSTILVAGGASCACTGSRSYTINVVP